ncbi:hypothetical protein CFC21_059926 [Triticum aestivum]|uniref:Uncharacterized protein n=2 Tax=Triticum aestivum TaxID=4565 RepID=A0A9R1KF18_WHEAT|nr:uncharacterized protein LOC123094056 [Triticum aestivum]KAF7051712.1 hypothetical protein CFC21_059926 [Triticum aestivum]
MMLYKIHSHAQIQDLQARSDELGLSNKSMLVSLVSLESVRIAWESYALLRPLIKESWIWVCPQLKILSDVAGLSLEIQKLEHDVLPQLKLQEAKLEMGALEAVLLMKNSAVALLHLRKCFKEDLGVLFCEDHLVSAKVKRLSKMLKDIAVRLLQERECNIVGLQERVRLLVQLVTEVLDTPVHFDDSDESSDESSDE